jgi:DNA-binding SARP family transcriptional activator
VYVGPFTLAKAEPSEAEVYHAAAMDAVLWLAHDDLRQNHLESALARARWLVHKDRWDHRGWRLLIETYLRQNNRRAARQQWERYLKLHSDPDDAVIQLARSHKLGC